MPVAGSNRFARSVVIENVESESSEFLTACRTVEIDDVGIDAVIDLLAVDAVGRPTERALARQATG